MGMHRRHFAAAASAAAVLVALILGAVVPSAAGKKSIDWSTDLQKAAKQAAKAKKPLMVDVYTDWCHWCKELDKKTYTDARVIDLSRKFVCVKVDGDKNRDFVKKYSIEGYPTIVFLSSKSKEIHRVVGYQGPDDFLKSMKEALKKAK